MVSETGQAAFHSASVCLCVLESVCMCGVCACECVWRTCECTCGDQFGLHLEKNMMSFLERKAQEKFSYLSPHYCRA